MKSKMKCLILGQIKYLFDQKYFSSGLCSFATISTMQLFKLQSCSHLCKYRPKLISLIPIYLLWNNIKVSGLASKNLINIRA